MEQVTQELLKYFLIGLALPNEKFWVNLRPDSPDDILDPDLEKTDIGRIFLEADVQLKKDTAGATSPQTPEGKQYWDKLYKKTGELFGSENITIPTITRPWIVPDEVIIRESPEGAYIYKATLKVMLEEDYLKSPGRQVTKSPGSLEESNPNFQPLTSNYSFSDPRLKELNEYSTQLIKETIIPKLTRQINTSKRYAPLRQVYYSLILAQWFKAHYREQLTVNSAQFTAMENNYLKLIDSGDLTNLASKESYDKQAYFKQYQESFRDGEYNLQEPVYTPMGKSVRRYMSGGMQINCLPVIEKIPGTGSPMLSRGLTFTKKYIIYLLAALPLATFSPQISVRAGTLPAATPEVINDDLRPNNLPQNMILYKGRLFEDLSDKMQRLLNNKSALSGENNEIEEAIRSVRRDLVIVTSNLSNLSAEDLIKLSNVWGKVNKIYKSARVGIYQQPWLRENKIFMDMIVELAFRFFNLEQRTKSENTLESLDILNIVFYIFSDCMLAEGNKLKETYLTHILNKGPTNEAIKDVGSVSYFSGKGRRSPDFNKKGLDFLKLSFGDKKYYSQDILKLNAPSYIKLYLWYSWAIEASLDNLKKDSVNIRNLAKSFLEEYKNKSINDIRVIFVEHENKKK